MKSWLALLLVCAAAVTASEPVPKGAVSENRFLFILNTSAAMRRCRPAAEACVAELVANGVQGRMRAGDSFGLWTFDKTLHAGEFPMQIWTPELNTNLARQVRGFLAKKTYESKTRFESVAGALAAVARSSRSLVVFLLTDGGDPVKGTPFDRVLNEAITKNYKPMKQRRLPFLIVFGVEEGQYTDIKLNSTVNIILPEVARVTAASPAPAAATNSPAALPDQAQSHPKTEPLAAPRPVTETEVIAPTRPPTSEPSPIDPPPPHPSPSPTAAELKNAAASAGESPGPSTPPDHLQSATPAARDEVRTNPPAPATASAPPPDAPVSPAATRTIEAAGTPAKTPVPAGLPQASAAPLAQNTAGRSALLLWAAAGFLFASVSLIWALLRGSKGRAAPSLISKSVEKSKRES